VVFDPLEHADAVGRSWLASSSEGSLKSMPSVGCCRCRDRFRRFIEDLVALVLVITKIPAAMVAALNRGR